MGSRCAQLAEQKERHAVRHRSTCRTLLSLRPSFKRGAFVAKRYVLGTA
jgi:hypothetical protein